MATKLAENLYHLDIPLVGSPLKNLNSYLIVGPQSLLIDTGFRQEGCLVALQAELDSLGINRDRLDVFATHLHSDHLGLAPQIVGTAGNIFISQRDLDYLAIYGTTQGWREMAKLDVISGFTQEEVDYLWEENPAKSSSPLPYDHYIAVTEGHPFHYGGYTLTCIETPGHTPGHMCLYDQENRRIFTGDHVLFHITPNICRWPGVADSLGDYLHSLAKVSLLDVDQMHTGHRHDRGDYQTRIAQLQAHHQARLADTLQAVVAHPHCNAYMLAGHLRWSIRAKNWEEFPLTQKFFAVGETLAHLDYLRRRGQVQVVFDGVHDIWDVV
ncbi:MBL fold metallo-hydrolase [Bengtsoniella intestinalis]|uniref:MBL fold metallo-hydrolase n=1 Tax=Bengtsoniella intestinalis TaxID=3073143 RepID=UPI00391F211F